MSDQDPRYISVTPMKNEGPFVLEWVAHNRAIGVDQMVVMTNDCTDGTDALLQRLDERGILIHLDNTSHRRRTSPQRRAYRKFLEMELAGPQDWIIPIDSDEQIFVKTGDHTLQALTNAVPDARMISMTWRIFGNGGIVEYKDEFLSDQFRKAAAEGTHRPPQAWGMKTMYQRELWGMIGVHRPKLPTVETMAECHWYNGSGHLMPERYFNGSWRSARDSVGYQLVQVNHYALKSCESYLVKKMRGRSNHIGDEMGLDYWNTMNLNHTEDFGIDAISAQKKLYFQDLMSDKETADLHNRCCNMHRKIISEMRQIPDFEVLWAQMTSNS